MPAQTYEITFTGRVGRTLRAEFDDCQVTVGPDTTTLRADLPDQVALCGLVQRITGFGLDIVDFHLVTPAPAATGRPDRSHVGEGSHDNS